MSRIVGIDLGTTNSLVAYVDGAGVPRVIPDAEGRNREAAARANIVRELDLLTGATPPR